MLVENGADVNAQNDSLKTALMIAAFYGKNLILFCNLKVSLNFFINMVFVFIRQIRYGQASASKWSLV
jgi:ankyrin repeat protein